MNRILKVQFYDENNLMHKYSSTNSSPIPFYPLCEFLSFDYYRIYFNIKDYIFLNINKFMLLIGINLLKELI